MKGKSIGLLNKVIAIVPAAGSGKRFGLGTNKPFQNLMGKPLIVWSLETLESVNEIVEIIPVLKEEDIKLAVEVFKKYNFSKISRVVVGGKERQDSVFNGLRNVKDKDCIILVHDGVRPLIERHLIEEVIKEIEEGFTDFDGVTLGVPLKDTIKEVEGVIVKKTLPRDSLWAIQTPQIFPYEVIVEAYEKAMREGFYSTDDAALIERYGGKVKIIMGSYRNIKITTPEDICIAEALLKM